MSQIRSGGGGTPPEESKTEPSADLTRADLGQLLAAQSRLMAALAAPAELLRFHLLAIECTAGLVHADRGILCLLDSEDPSLLRVVVGAGVMAAEEGELLPIDGTFEGRVLREGVPIRTPDLASERDSYPIAGADRAGPAIALPLQVGEEAIGVVLVGREPGGSPFLDRDLELLGRFSISLAGAVRAIRSFQVGRRARESVGAWKRARELERGIARYEALAAARGQIVFRLDRYGAMEWGAATEDLLGSPPSTFAPTLDDFLNRLHPADAKPLRSAIRGLMASASAPPLDFPCTLRMGRETDRPIRVEAWQTPDSRDVVGTITLRSRGSVPIDPATEAVAETIVRTLRHEINNPLAAVIGRAQLLIREDTVQEDPALRQSVETILYEGERIRRYVQALQSRDGLARLMEPLPGEEPREARAPGDGREDAPEEGQDGALEDQPDGAPVEPDATVDAGDDERG